MILDRVHISEVTLGESARASLEHYGIQENDVRLARSLSVSEYTTPEWLVVTGTLPDHRPIRMCCEHQLPSHIVKLRLI